MRSLVLLLLAFNFTEAIFERRLSKLTVDCNDLCRKTTDCNPTSITCTFKRGTYICPGLYYTDKEKTKTCYTFNDNDEECAGKGVAVTCSDIPFIKKPKKAKKDQSGEVVDIPVKCEWDDVDCQSLSGAWTAVESESKACNEKEKGTS